MDIRVAPTGHSFLFHLLVMQNTHIHSISCSPRNVYANAFAARVSVAQVVVIGETIQIVQLFFVAREREERKKLEFEQRHNRLVGFDRSRVHLEDACKMWMRYCSHMFGSIKILKQPMHSPADEDRTMAYSYSLPAHMHINFQFDQVHTEKIAFLERQRKPTARHTDVTRENGCWNSWINSTNSQWILIKIAKKKKIGMRNGISATRRQHFAFAEWKNRSEFYDAFAHRPPPATEKNEFRLKMWAINHRDSVLVRCRQ